MKRRIIVTGGAGFIGSHLVPTLLANGDEVIVFDNFTTGRREHIPAGAKIVEGCITDARELLQGVANVTHVIHLAALISSQDSLCQPEEYMRVNVGGLLRVVEATRGSNPRVLLASSSTVYGWNSGDNLTERTLPRPMTTYALTKLAGEHMLAIYSGLYGYSHVALRLFNVYGPRQNPDHPYANVTCKFAKAAADGTDIRLYGDGSQTRDFVYVTDVVSAFQAVLDGSEHPIYNVGTGNQHTIANLVEMTTSTNAGVSVEKHDPWPNDIHHISAKCDRIASEHGWSPKIELEEGFRRTIEFFKHKLP